MKRDSKGEFVIYQDYELDIIRAMAVFLGEKEPIEILFYDDKRKVIYFNLHSIMWEFSDNGGEFNIKPVNADYPISIPYCHMDWFLAINPVTMAYRLSLAIKHYDDFKINLIDWNFKYGDNQSKVILSNSPGIKLPKYLEQIFKKTNKLKGKAKIIA